MAGGQRKPLHLTNHIYLFSEANCLLHDLCLTFFSLLIFFKEIQSLKAHLHYCKPQSVENCIALHCQYELGHKKKIQINKKGLHLSTRKEHKLL